MARAPTTANTTLRFRTPREEEIRLRRATRDSLFEYAAKLERGETLTPFESAYIAAVLRGVATDYEILPKRTQGHQPEVDYGNIAMRFHMLHKVQGMSKTMAQSTLASELDISIQTVKNALKQYGDAAESLIGACRIAPPAK